MAILATTDQTLAVKVINLALLNIGVSKTITSLSDQSREGLTASLQYDHGLRHVLRQHPWPFATKYLDLTDTELGTIAVPINNDWTFAYTYPTDCVFARRIVPVATGRSFDDTPIPFRMGRESSARVIYTNEEDAQLEYTAIFDCPEELVDELFVTALAWWLASALAPSLSRMDKMPQQAWFMYLHTLDTAAAVASKEDQHEKPGEAEWIRARA